MFRYLVLIAALLSSGPAQALDWPEAHTRTILLHNRCDETWDILIKYSPRKDVWRKAGFFSLGPGKISRAIHNGSALQHRDNAVIYIYAETSNGRRTKTGDHGVNYGGDHFKAYEGNRLLRGGFVEIPILC